MVDNLKELALDRLCLTAEEVEKVRSRWIASEQALEEAILDAERLNATEDEIEAALRPRGRLVRAFVEAG